MREKAPPRGGASSNGASVACDDKHRLARFFLLGLTERDEIPETLLRLLDLLVAGLVEQSLPFLDKLKSVRQPLPQHLGGNPRLAVLLKRLAEEIHRGVRRAVIRFAEIARAARAGRKPICRLLGYGLLRLASPLRVDVNAHWSLC